MEVKNGIIIDGVLHEGIVMRNAHCDGCSLIAICHEIRGNDALCAIIDCDKFVNRGKITELKKGRNNHDRRTCNIRNSEAAEKERV